MLISFLVRENAHFAIYALAALSALASFWLYFDSWILSKKYAGIVGLGGWILLAAAFLWEAATIETLWDVSGKGVLPTNFSMLPKLRAVSYLMIGVSIWLSGLQKKPKVKGLQKNMAFFLPGLSLFGAVFAYFGPAIAAFFTSLVYFRRATKGLERHVLPATYVFLLAVTYELTWAARWSRESVNPIWQELTAAYGFFWTFEHILLALTATVLISWVTKYLLRRLPAQIFLLFSGLSLVFFVMLTATFTTVLMKNVQENQLDRIATDAKTLEYTLELLQKEVLSSTQLLASDADLVNAISVGDLRTAGDTLKGYLVNKEQNTLVVTDKDGQIIIRAEDEERVGGSLSSDSLVSSAMEGAPVYGLVRQEAALAPEISIRAAVPLVKNGDVIATVLTGKVLDSSFFDGIKHQTGLDIALMSGNKLASSTITSGDSSSRWVGTSDVNTELNQAAMNGDGVSSDSARILNEQYLAAYRPLRDSKGEVIGSLFVGVPFTQVVDSARKAVQLTMASTVILLVVLLIPTRWLAYKIGRQVR